MGHHASTQPLDAHTPPSPERHLAPPYHTPSPALLCHFNASSDHTHPSAPLPASLRHSDASSNCTCQPLSHSNASRSRSCHSQRHSDASSDLAHHPTPLPALQCHPDTSSNCIDHAHSPHARP
ncbi:hypothetical protein Pcinc_030495 [Petrolisthes cinctipes]|uniref:Uncharacterized protein n=1 Tax=Petrolisthes cinctipes TaxID=88211 RepID=A0AAE1EY96_PETCI|nr:hypothetical protein Pcinc_030495 [Petrolisthes cinctipes]